MGQESFSSDLSWAREQDAKDPLAPYRSQFYFPESEGKKVLYFTGNSLGLQVKRTRELLGQELDNWAQNAVEGHFKGVRPWFDYHKRFSPLLAGITGALSSEVVAMNTLTTNLNLLLVSFYRPRPERFKIMIEKGAFPSDQYLVEQQTRFHRHLMERYGAELGPALETPINDWVVELEPRQGELLLRSEDVERSIEKHGKELALILLGGVNYYTGQLYDMASITHWGHEQGALVGFDLAHAIGNVPLKLNEWQVDFAAWCSYKYLNGGPGACGGIFVHQKHGNKPDLPRFAGWWGHDQEQRFKMQPGFKPMPGAEGWQQSNAQIFNMVGLLASLELYEEVGMSALRQKSIKLTGYLEFLISELNQQGTRLQIISPEDPGQRGAQLSLVCKKDGKKLFEYLTAQGVMADWREPDVIRVAPVPLYNSFEDCYGLYRLMDSYYSS